MKKALATLLIPIFLLTTVFGVTITGYACKGMSTVTEKFVMSKPCCNNVGEKGCCNKESKVLKIKDAFVKVTHTSDPSPLQFIQVKEFEFSFNPLYFENTSLIGYWDNAPPLPDERFYILYSSLVI